MPYRTCPLCSNEAHHLLYKEKIEYVKCTNCGTIFCDELDNSNMVGGGFEEERNEKENHIRVSRINDMCSGSKKADVRILDWGCGHGLLIKDLRAAGYNCDGYDLYNEEFAKLPPKDTYHIVTSIECFEHFAPPFIEIDVIHRILKVGGIVMVETGFTNTAVEDHTSFEDWFYINPLAGHSTIYSHHGLDVLMTSRGFEVMQSFNRNVKLFRKKK